MFPLASAMMMKPAESGEPIGAYGNHTYWRLFATNNHGGSSFIIVGELAFLRGDGSTIATSGGTAIKSSEIAGGEATQAFDGSTATSWIGNSAANEWVGYQFATPVGAEKVKITTQVGGTNPVTRAPNSCSLQYSDDGSSWTTAFSFTNIYPVQGYAATYPVPTPATGYHRLWRLFCVDNNGGSSFVGIGEIEFRASSGGADQTASPGVNSDGSTAGRYIGSSIANSGNEGYLAFDNSASGWWAASGTTNQWLGFVFGAPVTVQQAALSAATGLSGTNLSRQVKNGRIEYSDDGTTWTSAGTFTKTGWTAGEQILVTVTP